ncbi:MAG TPA: hypothetical protein VGO91_15570 [Pyrinomonadaceae bacterium]|nr:hypothetical protein [Pyrinomonadaceae bacterium]
MRDEQDLCEQSNANNRMKAKRFAFIATAHHPAHPMRMSPGNRAREFFRLS